MQESADRTVQVSEQQVRELARSTRLEIAPGHMPGVIRNLDILMAQIETLFGEPVAAIVEPAAVFRPW